jgi:DNA-binding transcriptional regulator GbsR (MarR family)
VDFHHGLLAAESQQAQVIEEYIHELTGVSLQSAPELMRTVQALGLSRTKVEPARFKAIFSVRNQIIHELDINLDDERRRRNLRGRERMMKDANALLEIGEQILREVDEVLSAVEQRDEAAEARES